MKQALVAYLFAVALNLALLWLATERVGSGGRVTRRPAIVRLYEGAQITLSEAGEYGLRLGDGLYVSLGDAHTSLFPLTGRWWRLEAPVAVLN